jgi:choline dehydrogenase
MIQNSSEYAKTQPKSSFDYIVVGAGASGSVLAAELSQTGADVLVVESGGDDSSPTIGNPSIWFYNVGGPLDWKLPIAPVPQLNNRPFAHELKKLGISPVANLRGVGQNLHDHVLVSGVVYKYKGKMPDRPADSNAVEVEAYFSSGLSSHPADINLVLEQLPLATPEAAARFGALPTEGFTIAPALVQPTSRGQVRLASASWRDAPVIEANYLSTDYDMGALVRAIEAARELGRQTAFDGVREAEVVPGPKATTKQDLVDLARTGSASFGHAVGTAKIGVDADAVVDSNLRVHGIRGLRVADASVMPSVVAAPTNAPSIMIGGRAARLISGAA